MYKEEKKFITACRDGNIEVVDSLLEDTRVDPSAYDNAVIRLASKHGRL